MDNDRGAVINIGGVDYPMLLTNKATREIAKRYGGLVALGDKLSNEENGAEVFDAYIWLITLLINQPILIHNLLNKEDKKELVSEEYVELLTAPNDITRFNTAVAEAISRGMERAIESEDTGGGVDSESKNAETG